MNSLKKQLDYWMNSSQEDLETADILKSHNLIYLTELAGLEVSEEDENFFGILMRYQLEGRYPGQDPEIPSI